jgi:hypothetical protein
MTMVCRVIGSSLQRYRGRRVENDAQSLEGRFVAEQRNVRIVLGRPQQRRQIASRMPIRVDRDFRRVRALGVPDAHTAAPCAVLAVFRCVGMDAECDIHNEFLRGHGLARECAAESEWLIGHEAEVVLGGSEYGAPAGEIILRRLLPPAELLEVLQGR